MNKKSVHVHVQTGFEKTIVMMRVFDGGVPETWLRECDSQKVLSIPSGLKSKMEC